VQQGKTKQDFSPDYFDANGLLRLPLWFWVVLLLQARTWLIFVMAGVSRQQGGELLQLIYPDNQAFWRGMALGIPAALALIIAGRRQQWPRLWRYWHGVLIVSVLGALGLQMFTLWQSDSGDDLLGSLLALADACALAALLCSTRLRACFKLHSLS